MREYGGLAAKLPWMVTLFVITALSVVGLPMLNGFVGEFLVLSGAMQSAIAHHTRWTVLATTGVILTASYMLWMIQRVFYGDLSRQRRRQSPPPISTPASISPSGPSSRSSSSWASPRPIWMRAIDTAGAPRIAEPPPSRSTHQANSLVHRFDHATQTTPSSRQEVSS